MVNVVNLNSKHVITYRNDDLRSFLFHARITIFVIINNRILSNHGEEINFNHFLVEIIFNSFLCIFRVRKLIILYFVKFYISFFVSHANGNSINWNVWYNGKRVNVHSTRVELSWERGLKLGAELVIDRARNNVTVSDLSVFASSWQIS